jgi:hypothetical protein
LTTIFNSATDVSPGSRQAKGQHSGGRVIFVEEEEFRGALKLVLSLLFAAALVVGLAGPGGCAGLGTNSK